MKIDPKECENCGCQESTHPIPECKKFQSPIMTNQQPKWEEELKRHSSLWAYDEIEWQNILLFLRSHFINREELREMVGEMIKPFTRDGTHVKGIDPLCIECKYNQALHDLLNKLEEK